MKKRIIIAILPIMIIGGATLVVTSNNNNTLNEITSNVIEESEGHSNKEDINENEINSQQNNMELNGDIDNKKAIKASEKDNNEEIILQNESLINEEEKTEIVQEKDENIKPESTSKPEVIPEPEVMPESEVIPEPEVNTKPEITPEPEIEVNSIFMDQVESMIITKVNEERSKVGLAPLATNSTMKKYARIKSQDMGDRNYFDHKNHEGELITSQMQREGVSYMAWGENIAYISGQSDATALANQFMTNWMNSSGHRANILSDNFTDIGVGVYKIGNKVYATQEFYR